MVPVCQWVWGPPGKQGEDTKASPGKGWPACPSPLTAFLGEPQTEGAGIDRAAHPIVRLGF